MTCPFSNAELRWLHQQVEPYMPKPEAMLLGGSRGGKAGQQALKSSDYDILMLSAHIDQPVSLTLNNPQTGNKFDIILRDPDTLAYEVESARNGGNGTLLHLCAFSHIVYDLSGMAAAIQPNALRLYKQGPLPVTQESVAAELDDSLRDVERLGQQKNSGQFAIAAISLTHRFGRLALRANRHWVANGKVIARFLDQHLPEFKQTLEAAAGQVSRGNVGPFWDIVTSSLPAVYQGGENAVPVQRQYAFPHNPDVAEVYHYGRLSNDALRHYLQPDEHPPAVTRAAQDWVHYMFNLTSSAVDRERYARPNGEYRYALGRYLNQLMDTACLARDYDPSQCTLEDKASLLAIDAHDVVTALPIAWAGRPQLLHDVAQYVLADIVARPEPFQPRLVPRHLRLDAHKVGLI